MLAIFLLTGILVSIVISFAVLLVVIINKKGWIAEQSAKYLALGLATPSYPRLLHFELKSALKKPYDMRSVGLLHFKKGRLEY